MTCDLFGMETTNNRHCKACLKDRERLNRRRTIRWSTCPDCGGPTSGAGVVCYKCHGGDRE